MQGKTSSWFCVIVVLELFLCADAAAKILVQMSTNQNDEFEFILHQR